MKPFIMAAWAAVVLIAAPAAAQAPSRPPTASERAELRSIDSYIQELMAWNNGYVQVLADHAAQLESLNADISKATDFRDSNRTREGEAWAATWSAQRRAAMAALTARLQALPRNPPALPPAMAREPRMARALKGLGRTPDLTAHQIAVDQVMMNQMIDAAAAASGRDKAGLRLVTAFFDLNIAMLESQSAQQQAFLDMALTEGHPQEKVLEITIQYDSAGVTAMKLLRANLRGDRYDRAADAASIRAQARDMTQSAREMVVRTNTFRKEIQKAPDAPYVRKLLKVMEIYMETAESAMTLAARLDQLANTIERGAELDATAVGDAVDAMAVPLAELVDQDARRRAALSGG